MSEGAQPDEHNELDELSGTAERAVRAASDYLRERFDDGDLDAEYTAMDVKTEADVGAESRILAVLRDAHPDHPITCEESGHHPGDGDVRWVVDPLDGTNNFAIGSPLFGVAVTAVGAQGSAVAGESLASSIAVPVTEEQYVATRGGGVRLNGEPVTAADGDGVDPAHATVACLIGNPVLESPELAADHEAISAAVRGEAKRLINTWAPIPYFGMLAQGGLDAFVTFYPDEREAAAGRLLAREANCVERGADSPLTVFADDAETAAVLRAAALDALDGEPAPRAALDRD